MNSSEKSGIARTARVRFLTADEGGRLTPPVSGIRSQLELGDLQTSCIVETQGTSEVLPLGEEILVSIRLLFADQSAAAFNNLVSIELFEGNKLVATGVFVPMNGE